MTRLAEVGPPSTARPHRSKRIAAAEDDRPFVDVLQLADVPRPRVSFAEFERVLVDPANAFRHLFREALDEVLDQNRNILMRRSVEEPRELSLVLDLFEVELVDVDVVQFLVECETQGVRLAHFPAYIREGMLREKRPP